MNFRIGQKVVCVDNGDLDGNGGFWLGDMPIVGEVYTVTGLTVDGGHNCLWLAEIKNYPHTGCYRAVRFRPVVERKTDIGFATEILRKATRKRSVDA